MTFATETAMTLPSNLFRPHSATCWLTTSTITLINTCAHDLAVPVGTVTRIAVTRTLADATLRDRVTQGAAHAERLAQEGRTKASAMLDDQTYEALDTIATTTGSKRAIVMREALVVGAQHLNDFMDELVAERDARQAAKERGRERMVQMVKRFQGEVAA